VAEPDIWWLLPLTISLLIGAICPATGALLITQRRVLLANLMAHSVLPGLVVALAIGIDPSIGGLISGLLGALVAERLNRRFKGREEGAMNTDLLAANTTDLLRTAFAAGALLAMLIWGYRDLVFVGIDPEGAAIAKRPVLLIRLICSLITALVVISAITAVGVILVIGLLCAPVLMHVERSRSLKELMLRSASTGLLLCGGGMMLAIAVDLPPGPLIGTLCLALLFTYRAKTAEQQ
jgi:zinc/manganese transport system permease protein